MTFDKERLFRLNTAEHMVTILRRVEEIHAFLSYKYADEFKAAVDKLHLEENGEGAEAVE